MVVCVLKCVCVREYVESIATNLPACVGFITKKLGARVCVRVRVVACKQDDAD